MAPVVPAAPAASLAPVLPLAVPVAAIESSIAAPASRPNAASVLAAAKAAEPANLRPRAAISPVIGWLQVDAPLPVKVYANGRLLGTGTSTRFRLPVGRHLITLANDEQGIRSTEPVEIAGGRTALVAFDAHPASAQ